MQQATSSLAALPLVEPPVERPGVRPGLGEAEDVDETAVDLSELGHAAERRRGVLRPVAVVVVERQLV
jgi:hypothetical protein